MLRDDILIMEDCREEVSSYDELLAYVFKFWLRVRSLIENEECPEEELHRIWFENLPDYVDTGSEEFHKLYDAVGRPYYEDDVDEGVDFGSSAECGLNYEMYYSVLVPLLEDKLSENEDRSLKYQLVNEFVLEVLAGERDDDIQWWAYEVAAEIDPNDAFQLWREAGYPRVNIVDERNEWFVMDSMSVDSDGMMHLHVGDFIEHWVRDELNDMKLSEEIAQHYIQLFRMKHSLQAS